MRTESPDKVPPIPEGNGASNAPPASQEMPDGVPDTFNLAATVSSAPNATARRGAAMPSIDWREERRGSLPGNRYVRVLRPQERSFTEVSPSHLVADERV